MITDGRGEADDRLKFLPNRSDAEIVWCFILGPLGIIFGFGFGFFWDADGWWGCLADFGADPSLDVGE